MTREEQRRIVVLSKVLEGHLIAQDAVKLLGVSVRHCRRLLAAFRRVGAAALAHGNRGRPPYNRLPTRVRRRVVRLATTTYAGFNARLSIPAAVTDRWSQNPSRPAS